MGSPSSAVFTSPSWTRTNDTAVNSRMLYRLSYGGKYETSFHIRDLLRKLKNALYVRKTCPANPDTSPATQISSYACALKTEH